MKVVGLILPVTGLLLVLLLSGCSGAHDNVLPPAKLKPFTESLEVVRVWKENVGEGNQGKFINFEPAVVADKVITVDMDGRMSALLLATGESVWKVDLEAVVTAGTAGGGFGLMAMAVAGSEEGKLLAVSAVDGSSKWVAQLSSQVTAISDIDSGMLVARTIDGRVHGIEADSGKLIWSFFRETPALSLHGQSKPLIAHGGVALGLDTGRVVMLTLKEGNLIWELPLAIGRGRSDIERMVDIDGAMAFSNEELYAATFQGRVVAVDARRGKILWSHEASSASGVAVDDSVLYYTDEKSAVWALRKSSGIEVWKQDDLRFRRTTRPVVFGDTLVVADYDGFVHWLDRSTGAFVQRRQVASSGILAAPEVYGDQLLVLSDDGSLSMWKLKH